MTRTLDTSGFLFTEIAGEWSVLTADFGDGYGAGAVVGDPRGTRTWSMQIDALPDSTENAPAIPDDLEPAFLLTEEASFLLLETGGFIQLEGQSTRANYLWRFFRLSKAAGDEPFWIEVEDPDDGVRKLFLASFVEHKLSYAILCAKLYSTGLVLRERRLRNVVSPVLL